LTFRRFVRRAVVGAVAALALASATAAPSRADPAVQGITLVSVPFLIWALFADSPEGPQHDLFTFGVGWFDAIDKNDQAAEFRFEYRPGVFLWKFKPFLGLAGTSDSGFYAYGGLRIDAYSGRRIVVSPSFALVGYHQGDGKDLGANGVARSGIDISWCFDNNAQLGLAFHHMSHGRVMGDLNPGTEMISLTYSIPFDTIFTRR